MFWVCLERLGTLVYSDASTSEGQQTYVYTDTSSVHGVAADGVRESAISEGLRTNTVALDTVKIPNDEDTMDASPLLV